MDSEVLLNKAIHKDSIDQEQTDGENIEETQQSFGTPLNAFIDESERKFDEQILESTLGEDLSLLAFILN